MTQKKESTKIPTKNYVIYGLLVFLTIVLVLIIRNWYLVNKDFHQKNTIMSEFLVSVNEEEFENYTLEHNNSIIYLASSKDKTIENFEQSFKELLIDNNLKENMIFVDLEQVADKFFDNIKTKYFADNLKNVQIGNFTNVLIMENGKINAVLYSSKKDINIDDVKDFFYNRGVVGQAW